MRTRVPGSPTDEAEAKQACWALLLVCALPAEIANASSRWVQSACTESFFMNVRVLTDFYVMRHDPDEQIHRHSFLPGWEPTDGRAKADLKTRWSDFATVQVAHLLSRRIPSTGDPIVNVAPERLRLIAENLLALADEFVDALAAAGSGWEGVFRQAATDARANL